jgi:hypothetical protein
MGSKELPTEPFVEIFRHLGSSKELANVSLCCKSSFELVRPLIYVTVTQTKTRCLPAFLRTMLRRLDLAKLVKNLNATTFNWLSAPGEDEFNLIMADEDVEACRKAMDRFGTEWHGTEENPFFTRLPDEHEPDGECWWWWVDLRNSEWDATVALLMYLLPNLETLIINKDYDDGKAADYGYSKEVLRRATILQENSELSLLSMSKLRAVSIVSLPTREADMGDILIRPLLRIPSLTSFSSHGFHDLAFPSECSFNITNLSLMESTFNRGDLKSYLTLQLELKVAHADFPII